MKKILLAIVIGFLLLGMPAILAHPMQNIRQAGTAILPRENISYTNDTPPDWAAGNFSGVWGVNILGIPLPPIGWIEGYFSHAPGFGLLEGGYAEFNETNATNILGGLMIWIFFLGGVTNIATGNGTYVSGIGVANETHFYWRLNAIIGPSFYIHCEYSKFEE
jgi:hypothetical protein